jgi:hypothetical protein
MKAKHRKRLGRVMAMIAAGALIGATAQTASAHGSHHSGDHNSTPFINHFSTVTQGASSAPSAGFEAGDQNPYGVWVIPRTVGNLIKGNILVSNFNNAGTAPTGNLQGTGSSIVQYAPDAQSQTTFAEINASTLPGSCPGGVGLTTALVVLRSGWVVVGSLPTTDGTIGTVGLGCLIVLDANGNPVETFSGGDIAGPWDMTARDDGDKAQLFFSNVLNGNVATAAADTPVNAGTVVRMTLSTPPQGSGIPSVIETIVIGSGFSEENDPAALIIGPTGLGLANSQDEGGNSQGGDSQSARRHHGDGNSQGGDEGGNGGNGTTLYVTDTVNSRIARIDGASDRNSSAGIGHTVSTGGSLKGPLGLIIAPNGDILTVNSGDGNIVETTPHGIQTATALLAPAGAGSLFGLALVPDGSGIYFVDDSENQLNLFH